MEDIGEEEQQEEEDADMIGEEDEMADFIVDEDEEDMEIDEETGEVVRYYCIFDSIPHWLIFISLFTTPSSIGYTYFLEIANLDEISSKEYW